MVHRASSEHNACSTLSRLVPCTGSGTRQNSDWPWIWQEGPVQYGHRGQCMLQVGFAYCMLTPALAPCAAHARRAPHAAHVCCLQYASLRSTGSSAGQNWPTGHIFDIHFKARLDIYFNTTVSTYLRTPLLTLGYLLPKQISCYALSN